MILKEADDRSEEINRLRELTEDIRIPEEIREKILGELKRRSAGVSGENRSSYEINFHYGNRTDWVIIHDLRLEINGRVAQIDHLLINPALECFVLETKHYSEGVSINERDEFTRFYSGKPVGIDSPHEQNKKHIAVLQDAFDSGLIPLPKKLGLTIRPKLINLILVSPTARISLPKGGEERWSHVVKADTLKSWIVKRIQGMHFGQLVVGGAKMVSDDILQEVGRNIVALHNPTVFNRFELVARYGLSPYLSVPVAQKTLPKPSPIAVPANAPVAETVEESTPCCQGCGATVEEKVVAFCRLPKSRSQFGGKILCRNCQNAPATPLPEKTLVIAKPIPAGRTHCAACDVPVDDKVAFFCRLPASKVKFGGRILCRDCQPK